MPEKTEMNPQELEIERLKDNMKLAGGVCHEMKQPLMIISGYLELLVLKGQENSELTEKISKINSQLQRLSKLTTKLINIIQ